MATSTRFRSPIRVGRNAHLHDVPMVVNFTMDPTDATETAVSPAVTLPKGAIIDYMIMDGIGTGGTNPTVIMGDTTNTNGILDNYPSDDGESILLSGRATVIGSEFDLTPLPRDYTLVYLGGSGTDATGGTITCTLYYHMDHITANALIDASSE